MSSNLMKGVIDMHVHSNPDLRLRAYDDFEGSWDQGGSQRNRD